MEAENKDEVELMKKRISKLADGVTLAKIIKQALDMTIKQMAVANKGDNCDKKLLKPNLTP